MMKCRWWDSNPHGFPNDFESFASAIPPHRLIFNFGTLVPVSEDWRDVQEGCKKSCFDKPSKSNGHSWISRTDTENHEADFESLASAIPPHRLIWIWMRFARFFGSWRDVQEGCWNLSTANRPKTFAASLKFQMGARSREADFESPSSAIPTHRRIGLNDFYYTGFPGQNQEKVCVFFQIVPHGVKYMTPVLARRRGLCYTKVRSKRK